MNWKVQKRVENSRSRSRKVRFGKVSIDKSSLLAVSSCCYLQSIVSREQCVAAKGAERKGKLRCDERNEPTNDENFIK